MNNINKFINTHFDNAIKLKEKFKKTEKKTWDKLTVLTELYVQLGHLFFIYNGNDYTAEKGRRICEVGDEISDVLLQILYLSYLLKINIKDIKTYNYEYSNKLECIPILVGQLTEAIMELENYRFRKERVGFNDLTEFIKDRVIRILNVIFNFADEKGIDLIQEFYTMIEDATIFLENYEI